MIQTIFSIKMHPMVWQSETTQSVVCTLRTPVGCAFFNPLITYNYVKFQSPFFRL